MSHRAGLAADLLQSVLRHLPISIPTRLSHRAREPREFDVDPYHRTSALRAAVVSGNSCSTPSARLQQVSDPRTCRCLDNHEITTQLVVILRCGMDEMAALWVRFGPNFRAGHRPRWRCREARLRWRPQPDAVRFRAPRRPKSGMHFRSRIVTRKEQLVNDDDLVALNFKVPASFRMRLKLLAAKRATTVTQLLYEGFDLIDTKYARRSPGECADCADPAELA